jgi:hypothetical protein
MFNEVSAATKRSRRSAGVPVIRVEIVEQEQRGPGTGGYLYQPLLAAAGCDRKPGDAGLDLGQLRQQVAAFAGQFVTALVPDKQLAPHRALQREHPPPQRCGAAARHPRRRRQSALPSNREKQVKILPPRSLFIHEMNLSIRFISKKTASHYHGLSSRLAR